MTFNDLIGFLFDRKRLVTYGLNLGAIGAFAAAYFGYAEQISPEYGKYIAYGFALICLLSINIVRKQLD